MKEGLRSHLLADAGVAGLVADRVSWATLPRGDALPAIVLTQVSGIRDYAMTSPSGLVTSRVQVDCWAKTNGEATKLARSVNAALGGLRTTLTPKKGPAVQIQGAFLENQIDMPDEGPSPPEERLQRVMLDFLIWHDE